MKFALIDSRTRAFPGKINLFIGASALAIMTAGAAEAGTVQGNLVADNHAVVVLEKSPGQYDVITTSASSWPTPKSFSFNIPDFTQSEARQCKIHIIAWGDGSAAQGIAAVFQGQMQVMTPNGFVIGTKPNSVTSGAFPASASALSALQASQVLNAPYAAGPANPGWTSQPAVTGGIPGTWGPVNMPLAGRSTDLKFIWDTEALSSNPQSYRIATTPCASVQKPVEDKWVDVPGDHMQCYRIPKSEANKPESIVVADQFGKSEIVLGRPVLLCNPSTKVHRDKKYDVKSPKIHLACYEIIKQGRQPVRAVEIGNQFGIQKTNVDMRQMFCAPTFKKLLGGQEFKFD